MSGNLLIKTIGSRTSQETSPAFKYSQVIEPYEAELDIEIYSLGVSLSPMPYYSHSLAIDLDEFLSNSVFKDILQKTAHAQRRSSNMNRYAGFFCSANTRLVAKIKF